MDFNLYFRSRQGEMLSLLKEVVKRESPTSDKKAVDACSAFVIEKFKRTGSKVTRFPQQKLGDFYLVEYPPKADQQKKGQILILTHIDTVWPVGKIEKMPFYVLGGKVFGPGVLDMKAGLAMALFALKTLHELNIRPKKKIAIFINSAEEIGDEKSREIVKELAKKSEYVLCLEPALPGGALKTQRKGVIVVRLETLGKAAHSGNPEKGINAIDELLAQVRRLNQLRTKDVTMNVGLIGGGKEVNVVADHAWAVLDFRFWNTAQKEKILKFFKQLKPVFRGARVKFSTQSSTPPMEKNQASSRLLLQAKKIASSLNMTLNTGKTGGGSDASLASSLGVATLDGLGPDGNGIHSDHEHIILSSLVQRTALLTEMLSQL